MMPGTGESGPEFSRTDGIRIIGRAGAGRRSVWYRAEQTRLERIVAVKVLSPFLAESVIFADAFFDAGRQAAAIVHPAALSVINVYPRQGAIVMQWCPGDALRDLGRPLDAVTAASAGLVVMDCLASLHATGRSHGNLTPGNIFLGGDGGVWINDFFQPPVMGDGERVFRGDHRFIAPEVLSADAAGWRSDVFSLGCVLQEALEGAECGRELHDLLEVMRALDPGRRGPSPVAVTAALRRVKDAEEARLGGPATAQARRKRMYRRVPAEFDVSIRRRSASPGETAVLLNKIRDIGESGVFIETDDEFIRVGTILELDFALKGVEGNVHAFGVVRWKSRPPMPPGAGVQFLEVDQGGLANLRRFLGSV